MDTKKVKQYKPYLRQYMSFLTGEAYPKDHVFAKEDLRKATPDSIVRWMTLKAFGKEVISSRDKPRLRSTTMEVAKKALSHFMPDRKSDWSDRAQEGNPTFAPEVSDFIKYIKQKEVRHDGVAPQAKRPLTSSEFCAALTVLL